MKKPRYIVINLLDLAASEICYSAKEVAEIVKCSRNVIGREKPQWRNGFLIIPI